MTHRLRIVFVLITISSAGIARADTAEPPWQLDVDLGLAATAVSLPGLGGLAGGGGLGSLGGAGTLIGPRYAVGLERRLGAGSWLLLRASGSAAYQRGGAWSLGELGAPEQRATRLSFGGLIAARFVLLRSGPLELSGYSGLDLGLTRSRFAADGGATSTSGALSGGLTAGAVLAVALSETVDFRLTADLFRAGLRQDHFAADQTRVSSTTGLVGLQFTPTLGLGFRL